MMMRMFGRAGFFSSAPRRGVRTRQQSAARQRRERMEGLTSGGETRRCSQAIPRRAAREENGHEKHEKARKEGRQERAKRARYFPSLRFFASAFFSSLFVFFVAILFLPARGHTSSRAGSPAPRASSSSPRTPGTRQPMANAANVSSTPSNGRRGPDRP